MILGVASVVVSALTTLKFAPRHAQLGTDVQARLHFFAEIVWLNISVWICFSAFLAAGVVLRRRPQVHKRLMLLASLSFIPPAMTRIIDWPLWGSGNNAYFPLLCCLAALVVAMGVHDMFERRSVHPVTLFGGLGLVGLFSVGTFLSCQLRNWPRFGERVVPSDAIGLPSAQSTGIVAKSRDSTCLPCGRGGGAPATTTSLKGATIHASLSSPPRSVCEAAQRADA